MYLSAERMVNNTYKAARDCKGTHQKSNKDRVKSRLNTALHKAGVSLFNVYDIHEVPTGKHAGEVVLSVPAGEMVINDGFYRPAGIRECVLVD